MVPRVLHHESTRGERELRTRPHSAPHGTGQTRWGPGRAGHAPLPSQAEDVAGWRWRRGGPSGPMRKPRGGMNQRIEEALTRAGTRGPGCVAARRGPRAAVRPPGCGAARSWSGAEQGRPAGRPEKARRARGTGPARVSAEGPTDNNRVGQGCWQGTRLRGLKSKALEAANTAR
jgi:hypothetical protein